MSLWHRTVAKAIIRADDTGNYFIIRSTIPIMPGWSLVGGGISKHESPEKGLLREIQEELRLDRSAFSTLNKRVSTIITHHWILGIPITMTTHMFDLAVPVEKNFAPRPNWEIRSWKWAAISDMHTQLGYHYFQLFTHANASNTTL